MSQGYNQCLCQNGHYFQAGDEIFGSKKISCPHCGSPVVWYNDVDDTNCDQYGIIFMEPFQVTHAQTAVCNLGHTHVVVPPTYRVPSPEKTLKARMYRGADQDGGKYYPCNLK